MIIIGDTPEQLGSVTTANALIIDGKVFTKEQVIALQAERDALAAQLAESNKIKDGFAEIMKIIDAYVVFKSESLIKDSYLECADHFGVTKNQDEAVIGEALYQYITKLRTKAGE